MSEINRQNSAPNARARKQRTPADVWKPLFLEALARTCNVLIACREAGIDRSTAYKARDRSAAFRAQWEEAEQNGVDILKAEARRRALQGVDEPVFHKGEIVGSVKRYSDPLLMFLLRAHEPETYRERVDHRHSGPDGGKIPLSMIDDITREMNDEEGRES